MEDVKVHLDCVNRKVDFEVIEIIYDTKPYLDLLGIVWDFDNLSILNMKKRQMTFESKELRLIEPLDSNEGDRYAKPVREDLNDIDLEFFYKVIVRREHYINPIVVCKHSWTNVNYYSSDFDDALENW